MKPTDISYILWGYMFKIATEKGYDFGLTAGHLVVPKEGLSEFFNGYVLGTIAYERYDKANEPEAESAARAAVNFYWKECLDNYDRAEILGLGNEYLEPVDPSHEDFYDIFD